MEVRHGNNGIIDQVRASTGLEEELTSTALYSALTTSNVANGVYNRNPLSCVVSFCYCFKGQAACPKRPSVQSPLCKCRNRQREKYESAMDTVNQKLWAPPAEIKVEATLQHRLLKRFVAALL